MISTQLQPVAFCRLDEKWRAETVSAVFEWVAVVSELLKAVNSSTQRKLSGYFTAVIST